MTLQEIVDGDLSIQVHDVSSAGDLARETQQRLVDLGILDPPVDGSSGIGRPRRSPDGFSRSTQ